MYIKYFEDDRPRDYSKYVKMPAEERRAEIERLEAEARAERNKIRQKK